MLTTYFYFFFLLIILCGVAVIISRNPVQSVYFLILVFAFSSILFIILGAEFLAILVIIIYLGAISILFLFVVMMLNLRIMELYSTFYNYLPIGSFIGLFFMFEFFYALNVDFGFFKYNDFLNENSMAFWYSFWYKGNTFHIGWVLYNFFNYFVLISSLILLVAMIGSIVLTVDFEYRPLRKRWLYEDMRRDMSGISFWNTDANK